MENTEETQNKRTLADYCKRFAELRVNKICQRGDAPYKPILLLSVIDLISQGIIEQNEITVSDQLIATFKKYWQLLGNEEYLGGLHYPFFHLKRENFWHLKLRPDFDGFQPKSINKLKQAVEYAKLDEQLFEFIKNGETRKELVDILISVWFSDTQKEIEDILGVNQTLQNEAEQELTQLDQLIEKKLRIYKSVVRDAFFRKSIVHIYDYKCAFCGLRVTRSINQTIVDGAHIKPMSLFYDNKIDNGISFCKNHHWAFDRGWFTLDNDYKIVVAEDLQEISPHARPMTDFNGDSIFLPNTKQFYPRLDAIHWHRNNVFKSELG
ncbi:hypothetical protein NO976_02732 [Planktothrix agardhii]|jgi:putative restriction endonuclease|uniref:Uncharacterized protein n=1 Tax=Planktothrix agardhii (strain NIVA-CYA 126/8) TaxID=388467 RepID=A0A073CU61_PLAA1|nr:HNH endonuclease [Planktothrix agardhii]KEI67560.1 hypothetical protein A19Y_2673 [Planktothrix agardhii NIVA-CYA 126/8]MCB8750872.1 HNH endonuclease [Planktothrix agardhii 1810]MCP9295306.1 HNH endonuclease [Planktothrix agardhii LY1]MDS1345876.1 HNH endonuclease [Planktothrix agardhii NRERC-751]CAD5949890.1 hypothetical protein NIVACYA_02931 [Planktothrix agardhii]